MSTASVLSVVALSAHLALADGRAASIAAQQPAPAATPPAPKPQGPRLRALVITGGGYHDYYSQARILMEVVGRALPVDWTVLHEGGDASNYQSPLYNNAGWAKGYDVIVHNECFADPTDPTFIRKVTAPHKGGPGAMVIHCAMHTYRDAKVDDWREFLGVSTRRHTKQHQIAVKIAAADHPAMSGWKADWTTPMDELYVIDKIFPNAKALATAVSPEDQKAYPVVWANDYGGSRVFGTTLGHGAATWADPVFQGLLVRGFTWAAKKP